MLSLNQLRWLLVCLLLLFLVSTVMMFVEIGFEIVDRDSSDARWLVCPCIDIVLSICMGVVNVMIRRRVRKSQQNRQVAVACDQRGPVAVIDVVLEAAAPPPPPPPGFRQVVEEPPPPYSAAGSQPPPYSQAGPWAPVQPGSGYSQASLWAPGQAGNQPASTPGQNTYWYLSQSQFQQAPSAQPRF